MGRRARARPHREGVEEIARTLPDAPAPERHGLTPQDLRAARAVAALRGVAAAAAALGVGELVAAVLRPTASPVLSVGSAAIDATPAFLKEAVIRLAGFGDKAVLITVVVVVVLAAGAAAGLLERRRAWAGAALVLVLAVAACAAAVTRTGAQAVDVTPSLAAGAVGIGVLRRLGMTAVAPGRRAVLVAGVTGVAGIAAGGVARALTAGSRATASAIARVRLPTPVTAVAPLPAGAELDVPHLTPLVTANPDFYRIDIALAVPAVDPGTWALEVGGEVEHPFRITYADLLRLPMTESRTTLTCVSNPVGGDLAGTAVWLGASVAALLERAVPKAGADTVYSTGADGFSATTPLSALTDGRNAVLAVGMNGAVLPQEHGFPVRMVVPGLYGYVSATKWLTSLTVSRFSAVQAYWTQRGYSAQAPVKLASRIDTPTTTASAGVVEVAGVAWSQHVGIGRVQLRVDGGPWRDAQLSAEVTPDIWRQWRYRWTATSGAHVLQVRATDARGLVQTAAQADEFPNGATGLHTVHVTVS